MVKAIKIKKAVLEIPFVDDDGNEIVKFEFDKSDDSAERVARVKEELMESVAKAENDENYNLDKLSVDMKKAFDSLLGEGAYDKLYELSPSWEIMIFYFIQVCQAIGESTTSGLDEMNEAIEKYSNKFAVK